MKQQPEVITANILRRLYDIESGQESGREGPITEERKAEPERFVKTRANMIQTDTKPQAKSHQQKMVGLQAIGSVVIQSSPQGLSAQVVPPWWLAGLMFAWSVQLNRSYSGWKLQLRSFTVRPWHHPVFKAARTNDVASLQEMFSNKTASPLDVAEDGNTILHVSSG